MLALRLNTFIIQASITIVTYDRQNIFIVQATGRLKVTNALVYRGKKLIMAVNVLQYKPKEPLLRLINLIPLLKNFLRL
jgi:hypothetical protein